MGCDEKTCHCNRKKALTCQKKVERFNKYYANSKCLKTGYFEAFDQETPEISPSGTIPDIETYIPFNTVNFPCSEKLWLNTWCLDANDRVYEDYLGGGEPPRDIFDLMSGITSYELLALLDRDAPEVYINRALDPGFIRLPCKPDAPVIEPGFMCYYNDYFPAITYIFNQAERYEKQLNYSKYDIQLAIYNLVGNENPSQPKPVELRGVDKASLEKAKIIIDEALNAQALWEDNGQDTCKYLATNNILGVIAFPKNQVYLVNGDPFLFPFQVLVIQMDLDQFDKLIGKCPKKCY